MPGLRVHGGDHPVGGDPAGDAEHPVGAVVEVLADHVGEQPRRLVHLGGQLRSSSALTSAIASRASASTSAGRAVGSS